MFSTVVVLVHDVRFRVPAAAGGKALTVTELLPDMIQVRVASRRITCRAGAAGGKEEVVIPLPRNNDIAEVGEVGYRPFQVKPVDEGVARVVEF